LQIARASSGSAARKRLMRFPCSATSCDDRLLLLRGARALLPNRIRGRVQLGRRRSGGLPPPCSGSATPEHRPAATSRRSLQACIASLPLRSSLMSKTYLKSDHFQRGLINLVKVIRVATRQGAWWVGGGQKSAYASQPKGLR